MIQMGYFIFKSPRGRSVDAHGQSVDAHGCLEIVLEVLRMELKFPWMLVDNADEIPVHERPLTVHKHPLMVHVDTSH